MVEVDQSLNGIQVLLYLLRNDPALWFIIGFGLGILLISIVVDFYVDDATYSSNIDYPL
jgi:hypothetical protein